MIYDVDLAGAIPKALLRVPEALQGILRDLGDGARQEVVRLAHERLGTTTDDYVDGLSAVDYKVNQGGDGGTAVLSLQGQLPNMIERGWPGGDMKPFLLAGRNARPTKDGGRMNVVPFRHGTPGTSGRNFPEMGSAYQKRFVLRPGGDSGVTGHLTREAAKKLGRKIHEKAQELGATTKHPEGETEWGDRLKPGLAPVLRPHHKTDIYAGMVRKERTYKKATQPTYVTFRTVSDNSDPQAFVHPGIEARHLFDEAATYVQRLAAELIDDAMRRLL